jgi:siroheme synthase
LASGRQTIAVYMGRGTAGRIAERLIGAGMSPATPAAMIENATLPEQRIETAPLGELRALTAADGDEHGRGPALFLVGEVVRKAKAWVEPALSRAAG